MTDDIVDRLRQCWTADCVDVLSHEAADEIEKLRKQIHRIQIKYCLMRWARDPNRTLMQYAREQGWHHLHDNELMVNLDEGSASE